MYIAKAVWRFYYHSSSLATGCSAFLLLSVAHCADCVERSCATLGLAQLCTWSFPRTSTYYCRGSLRALRISCLWVHNRRTFDRNRVLRPEVGWRTQLEYCSTREWTSWSTIWFKDHNISSARFQNGDRYLMTRSRGSLFLILQRWLYAYDNFGA